MLCLSEKRLFLSCLVFINMYALHAKVCVENVALLKWNIINITESGTKGVGFQSRCMSVVTLLDGCVL